MTVDWNALLTASTVLETAVQGFGRGLSKEGSTALVDSLLFGSTLSLVLYAAIINEKVDDVNGFMDEMIKNNIVVDEFGPNALMYFLYRAGMLRDCLNGLGVSPEQIEESMAKLDALREKEVQSPVDYGTVEVEQNIVDLQQSVRKIMGDFNA